MAIESDVGLELIEPLLTMSAERANRCHLAGTTA
jgi:hypothetical protein